MEKLVNYLNLHTDIKYVITTSKEELHSWDYDIGISYCSPYYIKGTKEKPWFNYHPGPLPKYPGLMNYAKPVYDKVKEYGVTLHKMTEVFDKGPIIKVKKFKLDSIPTNTNELGCIAHYYLFQLFKETVEKLDEYTAL